MAHSPDTLRAPFARPATLFLLLLSAAGSFAQEPEPYRFGDFVDVQLVNVEAWVTDGKGNPVPGLTAEDFVILEDGKPVEISYFAEVGSDPLLPSRASRTERVTATDAASAESTAAAEPTATPASEPNHLVIYFDQLHLKPAGRNRLIRSLRAFLSAQDISPERVLILSQDYALQTEVTFGSSRQQIDDALDRLQKTAPAGGRVSMEKRLALQRLQDLWKLALEMGARGPGGDPCDFFVPRAAPEVELFAKESRDRIAITLDHLASAASFLSGVPGVKTFLYLSDSLERSPGSDLMTFVNNLCPVQDNAPRFIVSDELSQAFRQLTRHANTNRVTVYSLQAGGLEGSFTGSASQAAFEQQATRGLDTAMRFNERDGLSNLAGETGGRTIFNRNDFRRELEQIGQEMRSYYSLAYAPLHGGDELEHRVEVKVKGRNLRARHRSGYRDKSADLRMTERLQGAVYLGLVDNPMGVRLGAGKIRASGPKQITVPLHIIVPTDKVAFLPEQESRVAHLSVLVSTRHTQSQKGIFEQSAFRIRRPPEDQNKMVSVVMELTLPEGVHLVAVGLRDDATRETSFVTTNIELHAQPADQTP